MGSTLVHQQKTKHCLHCIAKETDLRKEELELQRQQLQLQAEQQKEQFKVQQEQMKQMMQSQMNTQNLVLALVQKLTK